MGYLIDTNILSELQKGQRADPCVLRWYDSTDSADLYLSVLVVGEIRQGIRFYHANLLTRPMAQPMVQKCHE